MDIPATQTTSQGDKIQSSSIPQKIYPIPANSWDMELDGISEVLEKLAAERKVQENK